MRLFTELTQLNEVCLLFWLGLSVSFLLPLPLVLSSLCTPQNAAWLFTLCPYSVLDLCCSYTTFCSFQVFVYVRTFFPLYRSSAKPFSSPLLLHLWQWFRRGFPSPNIFAIAFSFSVNLRQAGAVVYSRPLKSPRKATKAEAVSATCENCYEQGQECCCEPGTGNADNQHRAPLASEYAVVCSLSEKKIIPSKTMREDAWLLPCLSQPSVGLLTGGMWGGKIDQGEKFRESRVFQLMFITQF